MLFVQNFYAEVTSLYCVSVVRSFSLGFKMVAGLSVPSIVSLSTEAKSENRSSFSSHQLLRFPHSGGLGRKIVSGNYMQ